MIHKTTTDLKDLRKGGQFTWGELIAIHEINEYSIIEYHPWKSEKSHHFHIYVNQMSCSEGFPSLDAALAGCISYKHEGPNHHANYYFMKMIGKE